MREDFSERARDVLFAMWERVAPQGDEHVEPLDQLTFQRSMIMVHTAILDELKQIRKNQRKGRK